MVLPTEPRSSCGRPSTTLRVMSAATGSENTRSFRAAARTMSRSDRIPTGCGVESTTTSAPMLCSARSTRACLTVCSGRIVITLFPLLLRRLEMFMGVLPRWLVGVALDVCNRASRRGASSPRVSDVPRLRPQTVASTLLTAARRSHCSAAARDRYGRGCIVGRALHAHWARSHDAPESGRRRSVALHGQPDPGPGQERGPAPLLPLVRQQALGEGPTARCPTADAPRERHVDLEFPLHVLLPADSARHDQAARGRFVPRTGECVS